MAFAAGIPPMAVCQSCDRLFEVVGHDDLRPVDFRSLERRLGAVAKERWLKLEAPTGTVPKARFVVQGVLLFVVSWDEKVPWASDLASRYQVMIRVGDGVGNASFRGLAEVVHGEVEVERVAALARRKYRLQALRGPLTSALRVEVSAARAG